jgi:hypothetical protein
MYRDGPSTRAVAALGVAVLLIAITGHSPAEARGRPRATRITCGQTVTQSIRVANDLWCDVSGPVITIVGAGVTVDLGGHEIGQATPDPCYLPAFPWHTCGVSVGAGAAVTNGTLHTTLGLQDGTASRIRTDEAVSIRNGRFDRGRITDALVSGTTAEITRSHLVRSTIVFDDTFTDLTMTIRDNLIEGSDARPWQPADLRAAIHIRATYLFQKEVNGEIVGNRIIDSEGHGILYAGLGPNIGNLLVAGNDVRGSAESGISVTARPWPFPIEDGGPLVVRGNRSMSNGGHGIAIAVEGVQLVDGRRNVAHSNALDPQCTGVVCRTSGGPS